VRLYTAKFSPNPRRVHIFCEEKGIEIERVWLNMLEGEHRSEAFMRDKNPLGRVPVLELDDGRVLTESLAICEYLESLHPEPSLFGGDDPWRRAVVREATRLAELGCLFGASMAFQHSNPFFAERFEQKDDIAEYGRARFSEFVERLDELLRKREWLGGPDFSVADITLVCAIDFGKVSGCVLDLSLPNIARWHEAVRERPSCQLKRKKKKASE
jgi:glutathione S-transferase